MLDEYPENRLPRRTLDHPFSVHSSTSTSESESSASASARGELVRGESMDISSELSLVSESSDSDGFSRSLMSEGLVGGLTSCCKCRGSPPCDMLLLFKTLICIFRNCHLF